MFVGEDLHLTCALVSSKKNPVHNVSVLIAVCYPQQRLRLPIPPLQILLGHTGFEPVTTSTRARLGGALPTELMTHVV